MTITPLNTTDTSLAIASELAAMAEQLRQSTVQVRSRRSGGGSGVIWRSDGLIITNAHVLANEHPTIELSDGRVIDAVVIQQDPQRDLAALQVEATDLPAITIGDSDALRAGELVLAVGNPFGVAGALTTGIIHALEATDVSNHQRWVMADVRLAPGNSGGPLVNARGQAIGINTMIVGGLALAIPSKVVERFLRSNSRPYIGVTMQPVLVQFGNKPALGLLILSVQSESAAQEAGLQIGDVLIRAGGQFFNTPHDLSSAIWHSEPGELLPLEFLRGGKSTICNVVVPGNSSAQVKSP
jgi:serine protease Do